MSNDFVYTTFIRTTPDKLWAAITTPEFTRQYWGHDNVSDWKKGSKWQHVTAEGAIRIEGKVLESDPPKRLVLSWFDPKAPSDDSRVTFELQSMGDMVRLNVVHSDFQPGSTMPSKVAAGWPRVLSSLKTFLETNRPLDTWAQHNSDCTAA